MQRRSPELEPPIPPYGAGTLADVAPAIASLYEGTGERDAIGLPGALQGLRRACLLVVDGLSWETVQSFPSTCPTLHGLASAPGSRPISTCFPSTTVASLASISTGRPPGEHGMVGYTIRWPATGQVVNLVQFSRYGQSRKGSVAGMVPPEVVQPHATVFERLGRAGIVPTVASATAYEASGLTRATLRGAIYSGWDDAAEAPALVAAELEAHDPSFVYAYHPWLDSVGHVSGVGSDPYLEELARIDGYVAELLERLAPGTALVVTGDHGMVDVPDAHHVDFEDDVDLQHGVAALGGEPRIRHVYCEPGQAHRVEEAWRSRFGGIAWVARRKTAISQGWFGPVVEERVVPLIGDVLVAFREPWGVFQPSLDPLQARLSAHHGSFTPAETQVPLLVAQR